MKLANCPLQPPKPGIEEGYDRTLSPLIRPSQTSSSSPPPPIGPSRSRTCPLASGLLWASLPSYCSHFYLRHQLSHVHETFSSHPSPALTRDHPSRRHRRHHHPSPASRLFCALAPLTTPHPASLPHLHLPWCLFRISLRALLPSVPRRPKVLKLFGGYRSVLRGLCAS